MDLRKSLFYVCFLFMLNIVSLISPIANAKNEGRWYQVEILIFKRNNAVVHDEIWRQDITLSYPSNVQYLSNILSNAKHQLSEYKYILKKTSDYNILFHKAWKQQMWGKEKSAALIIRGGRRHGIHRELEGNIKIYIGRYLHLLTDLWLSEYGSSTGTHNEVGIDQNNIMTKRNIERLQVPSLPTSLVNKLTHNQDSRFDEDLQILWQPSRIITLRDKRRMRSKKTYYMDHPVMGVLVRILPIDSLNITD